MITKNVNKNVLVSVFNLKKIQKILKHNIFEFISDLRPQNYLTGSNMNGAEWGLSAH